MLVCLIDYPAVVAWLILDRASASKEVLSVVYFVSHAIGRLKSLFFGIKTTFSVFFHHKRKKEEKVQK